MPKPPHPALARTSRSAFPLALLALCSTLVACGPSRSEAAAGATLQVTHPITSRALVGSGRELPDLDDQPAWQRWFHPLDDYLEDPHHNPFQRSLTPEARAFVEQVFEETGSRLDEIERDCSLAQLEAARRMVARGEAERYAPGVSDVSPRDAAAVVIATFDESGPWLVRIPPAELPDLVVWKEMRDAFELEALDTLASMLRDDSLRAVAESK